jgi:hypothetical protein
MLRRIFSKEAGLLVVSLLVVMGLVEGAARRGFLLPHNFYADGWWRVMWLKRSAQYDARRAAYVVDKFHPTLGWTLFENLRDVPLGDIRVSSNSQGLRGVREYPLAKGEGIRILAIGDSYAFGECVNDNQTFSADLERLVDKSDVLNMGVHGYGTDQQLLRLQIDGLQYRPDVIVLAFNDDNISRNALSFRDYAKPHFSVINGALVTDNLPILNPEAFKSRFHLRTLDYLNIFLTRMRERQIEADNLERSKRILDQIQIESRSIGATLLKVYLPSSDQVRDNEVEHGGLFSYRCQAPGVVCVDPTSAMHAAVSLQQDKKQWFRCHYAPELHEIIAEVVRDAVAKLPRRR